MKKEHSSIQQLFSEHFLCTRTILCAGSIRRINIVSAIRKLVGKTHIKRLSLPNRSIWHNLKTGEEGKEAYLGGSRKVNK